MLGVRAVVLHHLGVAELGAVVRAQSSKRAHSLFEHPQCLSLPILRFSSSREIVDSDLPSALAMLATVLPQPSMNSMRFLSSLPMCFMVLLLSVFRHRPAAPAAESVRMRKGYMKPCPKVNAGFLPRKE